MIKRTFGLTLAAAALASVLSTAATAQTADIAYFQGAMLPANEVPPIPIVARGTGTAIAHVVRDSSGQIVSGSVDFLVDYHFPGAITITGLHIHRGPEGTNGNIVIPTTVSGTNPINSTTGTGFIETQAEVLPTDTAGVSALRDLFSDPSQFYMNLHTTDNPGGVIRAQLRLAQTIRVIGLMNTMNEVPPHPEINAGAVGVVQAIVARDAAGSPSSALVRFSVSYNFPGAVKFTGLHIHQGLAGVNGGITIPTTLSGQVDSDPSGVGVLNYNSVPDVSVAAVRDSLDSIYRNPGSLYINLHTTDFPGGIIRAQLRPTDRYVIPAMMLPSNEVPPIAINASAPARIVVNTIRGSDGSVVAGAVTFDVNYRFPAAATFTGLHIHVGKAGANGPVIINTGLSSDTPVTSDTGFGNIFRTVTVTNAAGLATITSLLTTPQNQYVNLHTTVNPGGVVRAQLGTAPTGPPKVGAVISAVDDATVTTLAPGDLFTIYGTNLASNSSDLNSFQGRNIPSSFNGVQVTIAGKPAPLIYISPLQINAQVPFDVPLGSQQLVVTSAGAPSTSINVTIAAAAPGIFFEPNGPIIVKNADFSLVRPDNRARANDILVIYATGLGQTDQSLITGQLVDAPPFANTQPVTITIGSTTITPIYSIASPNFIGLYQIAFKVPTDIRGGDQRLQISVGSAKSNIVTVPFISAN